MAQHPSRGNASLFWTTRCLFQFLRKLLIVRLVDSPSCLFPPPLQIPMSAHKKDIYLVIGGSGFLGRHIVQGLLDRGDSVSVFDIVQRYHDVPFYSGDITEEGAVAQALQTVRTELSLEGLQSSNFIITERCNLYNPYRVTPTWS